jgi:hypothetical protein
MNLAIVSDFNIAGQPTALWRAINKYTDHKARCIIAQDDSFQYDRDIILNTKEAKEEAADWCNKAEFFHFGRAIFNWPGVDFNKLLRKDNCCIKYYGSELRSNWPQLKKYHENNGIAAITGTDWTITGHLLNSFYHLGSYFTKFGDMKEKDIPLCNVDDTLRICAGSAGSPLKGYEYLSAVVDELQKEGLDIELEFIMQVDNKRCLERKLNYNATFTSLHGGWGISGVESMYLGHTVLSCLDPWVCSLYPNAPTVLVSRDNLKTELRMLYGQGQGWWRQLGLDSREFAIRTFDTKTILKRYLYLFDLIQNGDAYLNGGRLPKAIYNF